MNRLGESAEVTPQLWSAVAGGGGVFVVLVHGSLDRSAGLLKLSRRLDERYLVARYDRRGYGRSQPHPGPFGIDGQVDDLVEVIRRHAPGTGVPCIVIGHSYGGNVALATVDRHPGLIDAVVTYETPLSWLAWWSGGAGSDAVAWQNDPEEAAERFMRRLIGDDRWARLPASTRTARRAEGPAMVGELIDLRSGAPWRAERIDVPVRCLYGEHGRSHHQRGAQLLADMLPDARAIRIDGAHHFGPNSHPDDVGACIIDFIDRVTR